MRRFGFVGELSGELLPSTLLIPGELLRALGLEGASIATEQEVRVFDSMGCAAGFGGTL
jgi:hypothetical protein